MNGAARFVLFCVPDGFHGLTLTGLKRKVEWTNLVISKNEQEIRLYTTCRLYEKLEDNSYGDEISRLEVKPFERILYAKNINMVNPDTGLIVEPHIMSGDTQTWIDVGGNVCINVIGMFDYFINIMNENIIVNNIVENIIFMEDQFYKT